MMNYTIDRVGITDYEKQLAEIKDEMRAITNTLYNVASGNEKNLPVIEKELSELTDALHYLADKRIKIERLISR